MWQDAVCLNEEMRLHSMETTETDEKFRFCSELCKFLYSCLWDCTEGELLIPYNHNFNLQTTNTWVRDAEPSSHSVLVSYLCMIQAWSRCLYHLSACQHVLLIHRGKKERTLTCPNESLALQIMQIQLLVPATQLTATEVQSDMHFYQLSFLDFTNMHHEEERKKILLMTGGLACFYTPFLHQSN